MKFPSIPINTSIVIPTKSPSWLLHIWNLPRFFRRFRIFSAWCHHHLGAHVKWTQDLWDQHGGFRFVMGPPNHVMDRELSACPQSCYCVLSPTQFATAFSVASLAGLASYGDSSVITHRMLQFLQCLLIVGDWLQRVMAAASTTSMWAVKSFISAAVWSATVISVA